MAAMPVEMTHRHPARRPGSRLGVRLAWLLLEPAYSTRALVGVIAGFAIVGFLVLCELKWGQHIYMDGGEAYSWGRHFLAGYGRHPPVTGWIAGIWYLLFPAEKWASYLLSRVMVGLCLCGIYLVARKVTDRRRALLVLLTLFAYPLMIGAKSEAYNNYQVLQAILPFVVLAFLVAWERRTGLSGALLGLAAGLATLTIYLGIFLVLAIAAAAVLHPERRKFFASKAPYVAAAVYLVVLSPHLIWLAQHDFASVRFASKYVGNAGQRSVARALAYLGYHAALISIPLLIGLWALWPLKFSTDLAKGPKERNFLLPAIVAIQCLAPLAVFIALGNTPTEGWGNAFFTLVPVALLALMPGLIVRRQALVRAGLVAASVMTLYLATSWVYSWINFRQRPDYAAFTPVAELSEQVTRAWRDRVGTPLPIVVSDLEHTSYVAFYSKDHPLPVPEFAPLQAPWLDFSSDSRKLGYVGICHPPNDRACFDALLALDPAMKSAERIEVTASPHLAGMTGPPRTWYVWLVRPRS